MEKVTLILGSQSKPRKAILEEEGFEFSICVAEGDEYFDENLPYAENLKNISRAKADEVMGKTNSYGHRVIVCADQMINFEGKMYGKPKSMDEARATIKSFLGKNVKACVGNTIFEVNNGKIIREICTVDEAVLEVESVSDEELENYLENGNPFNKCGGINVKQTPFVRLVEGKMSTARGITVELLKDFMKA